MAKLPIKTYARITDPLPLPVLIDIQLESFDYFIANSISDLFNEISPIESYNGDLIVVNLNLMCYARPYDDTHVAIHYDEHHYVCVEGRITVTEGLVLQYVQKTEEGAKS